MTKLRIANILCACLIGLSFDANSVVKNTLNGTDYEWLEFSATYGLSRVQVEAQIAAASPGDPLYGYAYASRELTEALLLSYAPWDSLNGYHNESAVIAGFDAFFNDFGSTYTYAWSFTINRPLTSGGFVKINNTEAAFFHYGADLECSADLSRGCVGNMSREWLNTGPILAAWQDSWYGWSSTEPNAASNLKTETTRGSLLVRVAAASLAPVADPSGPYTGTAGQQVVFDGSGSYDPDGSIITYDWSFGDGNTGTGVSPVHTYAAEGNFDVSLTVMDNDGLSDTAATSASIAAAPQDPVADPNGPYDALEGNALTLDGSGSYDPDGGDITQYDWDFGDGNTGTGVKPTHTYIIAGNYQVSLTVVDDEGAISTPEVTTAVVRSLAEVITEEIGDVQSDLQTLVDDEVLKAGQANGLSRPLNNTLRSIDRGKTAAACSQLQDYITEVNAKTPAPLDAPTADALVAEAEGIRALLGCD